MFHCAPPEVSGLGVITTTSSRMRSSQPWMFLGLPGRTANDDDAVVDDALVLVLVPVGGHDAGLHQALDVRPQGERDDVGGQAGGDGAALVAGRAVGLLELDAGAGLGRLERGMISAYASRGVV